MAPWVQEDDYKAYTEAKRKRALEREQEPRRYTPAPPPFAPEPAPGEEPRRYTPTPPPLYGPEIAPGPQMGMGQTRPAPMPPWALPPEPEPQGPSPWELARAANMEEMQAESARRARIMDEASRGRPGWASPSSIPPEPEQPPMDWRRLATAPWRYATGDVPEQAHRPEPLFAGRERALMQGVSGREPEPSYSPPIESVPMDRALALRTQPPRDRALAVPRPQEPGLIERAGAGLLGVVGPAFDWYTRNVSGPQAELQTRASEVTTPEQVQAARLASSLTPMFGPLPMPPAWQNVGAVAEKSGGWNELGEAWQRRPETPEKFMTELMTDLTNLLPVGPVETVQAGRALARAAKPAAQAAARGVQAGAKVAGEIARMPALERIVPRLGIEDVSKGIPEGIPPAARQPWEMTQAEFIANTPAGFKFDPAATADAYAPRTAGGPIAVGPKFFSLSEGARKGVIDHEIGHALSDSMLSDQSAFALADSGAFGPKSETTGELVRGINGATTPGENVAAAYSLLVNEPQWLKRHFPQAYDAVAQRAIRDGFAVPPEVLADYPDLATQAERSPLFRGIEGEGAAPTTAPEAPATATISPELERGLLETPTAPLAPIKPEAKPLPPMTDNYIKPLSTYAETLYRETSLDDALSFFPNSNRLNPIEPLEEIYFANVPELALGQGKNRGVLLELDASDLQGKVNTAKPSWEFTYRQGQAELLGRYNDTGQYRQALRAITIQPKAEVSRVNRILSRRFLNGLEEQGWTKTSNSDGSITWRRPSAVTESVSPIKLEVAKVGEVPPAAGQPSVPPVAKAAQPAAPSLAAPKPGFVRLYRGSARPIDLEKALDDISDQSTMGRWFTVDRAYAEDMLAPYAGTGQEMLVYVDVPEEVARQASRTNWGDPQHVLPPEWAKQAKLVPDAEAAQWKGALEPPLAPPPEAPPATMAPPVTEVPGGGGRPPEVPPPPPGVIPPSPLRRPRPGYAGNIKLSKYPEELRPELQAVYDADPAKFEAARRGVRSDKQVRFDAIALINSVGGKGEKSVKNWVQGQAWNAEEMLALREVLATKTRAVIQAQKAVREMGDSTASLVRLRLALEEQNAAQKAVSGVTAEAGRALRQFHQTVEGVLASGDERQLKRILDRMGGRQTAEELANALSKIDLDNQEAVFKFVRSSLKPKRMDYITEIFYNSILSGPRTHEVNIIGNTLAAILAPFETAIAAAIELPLAAIQRRPRGRFLGEVKPEVFGMVRAIPDGIRKAAYILKNGYSWDDVAKLELRRPPAFTGKPGAVINLPSRSLTAVDALLRAVHYAGTLNSGAYRIASREGLKGEALANRIADLLANPSDELLQHAGKMARYRVYQQEPGTVTRGLLQIRDTDVAGVTPLRFVLPFIQTPANLLKYGLERSPLGILNPDLARNIAKKSPEAADNIARWVVGSGIAAAIAYYAADGKVTGPAPESPTERDRFYRQGKQPYSLKIGDRWVPYNRLEPMNQGITQVALAVEAMREGKDAREIVGGAIAGIGKNFVSQTYMSGIADLLDALQDPERYGANLIERATTGILIPFSAATRTIAQSIDPTIRAPKGFIEEVQAGIPGLSQNLPPRLTAFGEEIQRESPAYWPVNVSRERVGAVDTELARLRINVGFVGDSIKKVTLTREEQQQYQRLSGQLLKTVLEKVVASPIYQRLDDETKASLIQSANRRAKDAAGNRFLGQLGKETIKQRLQVVPQ